MATPRIGMVVRFIFLLFPHLLENRGVVTQYCLQPRCTFMFLFSADERVITAQCEHWRRTKGQIFM